MSGKARSQAGLYQKEAPAFRPGSLICPASAVFRPLLSVHEPHPTTTGQTDSGLKPTARLANEAPRPEGRGFNDAPVRTGVLPIPLGLGRRPWRGQGTRKPPAGWDCIS